MSVIFGILSVFLSAGWFVTWVEKATNDKDLKKAKRDMKTLDSRLRRATEVNGIIMTKAEIVLFNKLKKDEKLRKAEAIFNQTEREQDEEEIKELKKEIEKLKVKIKEIKLKEKETKESVKIFEKASKSNLLGYSKIKKDLEVEKGKRKEDKETFLIKIKGLENQNKETIKSLEITSKALALKEENFTIELRKEVDVKLVQMIRRTSLAQRYISEMYRRGEIDLDRRKEIIAKTQIIQEIENKVITEKNAQILTREGRLQLQMNTNIFELRKMHHDLDVQIVNFSKDKRDYEYNKRIEQDKWEIKKAVDKFDLSKQQYGLDVFANQLQNERERNELLNLSERLNLEKTKNEIIQFANKLELKEERLKIQKVVDDFDLDKQRQKLNNIANKLQNQKERDELLNLSERLNLEKTKNEITQFANKLELKEERHEMQVMIDDFDLKKGRTALITAKEKFLIQMERESHNLQVRINDLDSDKKKHDLQVMMDSFNIEVGSKRGELEDIKRNVVHDIQQHDLQKQMDGFNVEMREQTHSLKVMHDTLQIKEQGFDVKVEREKLNFFNREIQNMKSAVQQDYERKKELLEIRADRGELKARESLLNIEKRHREVQDKMTDLQFTKREIKNFATEKEQHLVRKELKYKQDILYSIYDQLEKENPQYVDKVFNRMGFMVNSPYKEENQRLRQEKSQ